MLQGLIRRISSSILPRSDRPWSDDATSNAPTIGRKRRLSTPGEGDENDAKRVKGVVEGERDMTVEEVVVKEVAQGVTEVDLEVKNPIAVPLPATPPPEAEIAEQKVESAKVEKKTETNGAEPDTVPDPLAEAATITSSPAKVAKSLTSDTRTPLSAVTGSPTSPRKSARTTRKLPARASKPASKGTKKAATEVVEEEEAVTASSDAGIAVTEAIESKKNEGGNA